MYSAFLHMLVLTLLNVGAGQQLTLNQPHVLKVDWQRSMHSVSWRAHADPSHAQKHCIDPAPFGKQCTVHLTDALASCVAMNCKSVICPDQTPYFRGKPSKGIRAEICQLRQHVKKDEPLHGMCKPKGCTLWSLSSMNLAELLPLIPTGSNFDPSTTRLALVLNARLIQNECRGSTQAVSSSGCACLNMLPLGRVVLSLILPSDNSLLCVIE